MREIGDIIMNKKTRVKRYWHAIQHMSDAYQHFSESKDLMLFIFGSKPAVDIRHYSKCERDVIEIIKRSAEMILCKKLYIDKYSLNKEKGLFLLKKPLRKKVSTIEGIGITLGIPICCVKKYVSEDNGEGYSKNSAMRYIKQLEETRRKIDLFGIYVSHHHASCDFGFVPCSPLCKKALKISDEYKNIQKRLKLDKTKAKRK